MDVNLTIWKGKTLEMSIGKMKIDPQLIRFFLVGCINSAIGLAVMLVCYYGLFLGYWLSSALNYLLSSICSYFLNRKYTFDSKERNWQMPLKFTVNIIVCYFTAYSLATPLMEWFLSGIHPAFAEITSMLAGMVLFSLFNYIGQSLFVFHKPMRFTQNSAESSASGISAMTM